jgi:hypothetical protein
MYPAFAWRIRRKHFINANIDIALAGSFYNSIIGSYNCISIIFLLATNVCNNSGSSAIQC